MQTSVAGRKAITRHEGLRLNAYPDPATGGAPWTIGVGHTSAAGPPKVAKGMKITAKDADAILSRDLATFEAAVNKAVKVPLNQNEFDALVSLAFNIGAGAFSKSTLVRKLNAGDRAGAADAFLSWNKAAGKVMKGLTTRRQAERKLFLTAGKPASASKPVPAPKPPAKPQPAPVDTPDPQDMVLQLGTTGKYVEDLQRHLNTLDLGPLTVDGKFGKGTEDAVKTFQRMHGLKVDGIAGPRTMTAIGEALLKPKLVEAEKEVPATATKEVKAQTGLWGWIVGALGGGGASVSALAGSDWQTVLAIGAVAIVGLLVLFLLRRQLVAAFKDINAEARQ